MKILDCTLRDGGYYTNWDFDSEIVKNYLKSINGLPIEYIEIGYRNNPLNKYFGEFYYCPESTMIKIKELCPQKKLSIMLNAKDVKQKDLPFLLDICKPYIHLVRMAVDPRYINHAIDLGITIKEMGFEIAVNIMYMSQWKTIKGLFDQLTNLENVFDYIFCVDSFGGITPSEVSTIIKEVNTHTNVPLGFHAHNNMELALINSIVAYEAGCCMIDTTITGMGRGAGNLKTELLLTYLDSKKMLNFPLDSLSEVVDCFEQLKTRYGWGTNLAYMISGANSLPQKDVMDWMSKKRYSFKSILNALQNNKNKVTDNLKLPVLNIKEKHRNVIIIGGGQSAEGYSSYIKQFIKKNDLTVIHSSAKHIHSYLDLNILQYYCIVGNEAYKLSNYKPNDNAVFIYSPYPREMGTYCPNNFSTNSYELRQITVVNKYKDAPIAVALELAIEMEAQNCYLVGFDGYAEPLTAIKSELQNETQWILDSVNSSKMIHIQSLTQSTYKNIEQSSIFCYI